MAGPSGILLLLDDSHLADDDTFDLLPQLVGGRAEEPDNLAIRVIATYCATEVDSRSRFMQRLGDLMRMQAACHLSLAPLEPDDASTLLEHLLPNTDEMRQSRLRDQLRRAGGVPFFLVHCAEQLRLTPDVPEAHVTTTSFHDERVDVRHRPERSLPAPWIVAESIRRRLAELPTAGYNAVQIAALAGPFLSGDILLEVLMLAGHTAEQAVAGVEAAVHARLLLEGNGPAYTFACPLIEEVVVGELGAARKMLLRLRLGEACEAHKAVAASAPRRESRTSAEVQASFSAL
jgi:hypothetical protein